MRQDNMVMLFVVVVIVDDDDDDDDDGRWSVAVWQCGSVAVR